MSTLKTNTIQAATGTIVSIANGTTFAPTGHVIQTVQTSMGDRLSLSTGGNFTKITGFEAAITPSSTSSKILVQPNVNISGPSSRYTCGIRLYVNNAHLSDASANDGLYGSNDLGCFMEVGAQNWSNFTRYQVTSQYLHSPNSTSQQTYSLYVADGRDDGIIYVNRQHYTGNFDFMFSTKSYFTLMEIAG